MTEKNKTYEIKDRVTGETYSCNIEIYDAGIIVVDKDNVKSNSITDTTLEGYCSLTGKQKEVITQKIADYRRKNLFPSGTTGEN